MEARIKGSIVEAEVAELRTLVQSGRVSEEALRAKLSEVAAELALDQLITMAGWYPVDAYDELLRYLAAESGRGYDYFIEGGRETARRLVEAGVYPQLNQKGEPERTQLELIVTLARSIYDFTIWTVGEVSCDAFELIIDDAARYPESLVWRNVGFLEISISHLCGGSWSVSPSRPTPDRVVLSVSRT